jgi:hypothetical protein
LPLDGLESERQVGNDAVEQAVCVVCAGKFFKHETNKIDLCCFAHKDLLRPCIRHPHQHLVEDTMVVYNAGVCFEEDHVLGRVCRLCQSALNQKKTPPLALANNLWLGDIPAELSMLTLPEHLLVARYYPAVYVVKLYPKKKGARYWDPVVLNSGLHGNVSTFRTNTQDVASMVEGNILPHLLFCRL